MPNVMAMT